METRAPAGSGSPSGRLRLVWENSAAVRRDDSPAPALRLLTPPPVPARPVKLDLAVERHLAGADGLTRDQFLVAFSGRATRAPAPALS